MVAAQKAALPPASDSDLAALAFTRRKLEEFGRMLAARGLEVTYETEEFALDGGPMFSFPCPSCREALCVYGSLPGESVLEPNLLGFAYFMHEDDENTCRAEHSPEKILAYYGVTAPAGVNLELVRLKRAMAGGQVEWLIPGVMERGKLVGLFGPPKTGKSLLALQWAVELAQGGQRVVYLDEENDPDEVDARLEDMGVDPSSLAGLTFHSFTNWAVDTEEGAAKVLEACTGVDLVIFDSWAKFFANGSQSDDAAINRAYRLALKPLRAARVGVVRLDHTGHAETLRPSGSVQKLADVDHNWLMRAKKVGRGEPVPVTLTHTENRTGRGEDVITMTRELSPVLRHVASGGQADAPEEITGTTEDDRLAAVVEALDDLSAPTDWTVKVAQAALRKAGKGARTGLISEALKIRRREPTPAA